MTLEIAGMTETMKEQELLGRVLAVLDPVTAHRANQIAVMIWPERQFSSQKTAGVAAQKYLARLAHKGLARTSAYGWLKVWPESPGGLL